VFRRTARRLLVLVAVFAAMWAFLFFSRFSFFFFFAREPALTQAFSCAVESFGIRGILCHTALDPDNLLSEVLA